MKYEMVKYNCDGCMFGVVDKDGNILQESWTIAFFCWPVATIIIMDSPGGPSNVLSLTRMK